MNLVREKVKTGCKLLYNLLKESYGYKPLLDMYPFPILIQLKYFLGGVHHFITVVGKCIFDGNFPYALPLTKCELEYCFINNNKKRK